MTITLSDAQKAFVDAHVKAAGLRSASQHVAILIRLEHLKKHRDKIDGLLLEGLQSGPATPMTWPNWEEVEREGLARLAEGKKDARKCPDNQRRLARPA
ncbi:MAG TPA: hypothetical protein VG013_35995 [Gemmataceae bacterium]|nr:hypothetical protein [Gemmataceae bacterium]